MKSAIAHAPILSLVLVLVLSGLAGLLLSGCGEHDRYILVPPEITLAPLYAEGVVENMSFPGVSYSGWRSWLVLADGDYLAGDAEGRVFRITGDVLTDTGWPRNAPVCGLVQRTDGLVFGVDENGRFRAWDGESWTEQVDLGEYGFYGMILDQLERPVVYGRNGRVRRLESDAWVNLDVASEYPIHGIWSSVETGLIILDRRLQLFQEGPQGWVLSEPFEQYPYEFCSSSFFSGDDLGNLVMGVQGHEGFWFHQAGDWIYEEIPQIGTYTWHNVRDLFWQDGALYGLLTYDHGIYRRQSGSWQMVRPIASSEMDMDSGYSHGSWRYFVGGYGQVHRFANGVLENVVSMAGYPAGVVDFGGQTHLLTSRGSHYLREDGSWRWLGRPIEETTSRDYRPFLFVDDRDHLVFHGYDRLVGWQAGAYETLLAERLKLVEQSFDGSLLLERDGQFGRLADGAVTWFDTYSSQWRSVDDVALTPAGDLWVLKENRLGRLTDDGTIETELIIGGWYALGLLVDPERGLIIYGHEGLLLYDGEAFRDETPWLGSGEPARAARLHTICLDSQGRWVGWDRNSQDILRYDGSIWRRIVPENFADMLCLASWTTIGAATGSDIWLWEGVDVIRFRAEDLP